jgi:hypothetical protein
MLRSQLAGLTPLQIAIVMAIFIVTLCGAITAALAFRWWNELQNQKKVHPAGASNSPRDRIEQGY